MIQELESKIKGIQHFYTKDGALESIVALDGSTTGLGPAIGGCRFLSYDSIDTALQDVSRLAKAMTYKAAIAGLRYRGGKSVILKSKHKIDRELHFKKFAAFVNQFKGDYITAVDSGTTTEDMYTISRFSPFVTGYNHQCNGEINPSFYTAQTVLQGLFAAATFCYGNKDIANKKVLIKGVGSVGSQLVKFLHTLKARIFIADTNPHNIEKARKIAPVSVIDPANPFMQHYDIICPCDVDFTVTEKNIDQISADIIVGATNNQLENDGLALELKNKNIVYCPDYVVNAGGLIYIVSLYEKKSLKGAIDQVNNVYDTTLKVLKNADLYKMSTKNAADDLVEIFIDSILDIKK